MSAPKYLDPRLYLRQQPVMLSIVAAIGIVFFLFVTFLSRTYYTQRQSLGNRWFQRGVADLQAKNYAAAVTEFRAALLYSRDDYDYQLNLAEALIGAKHAGEASAYLLNLWDREPEDGLVNLELARIAAQQGQIEQSIRHYHDAVYAAWPAGQEQKRRDARFELIELLLRTNAKTQAQAELIALAENVDDDPEQQQRIGDLFIRAQDYEHALASYRIVLKSKPSDPNAMAGAGNAAFALGRFALAKNYLSNAGALTPQNAQVTEQLKMSELVLKMDPYRPKIPVAERNRSVMRAFAAAGQRLRACEAAKRSAPQPGTPQLTLSDSWAAMKARLTEAELRRDPELMDSTMELAFRIERQSDESCGPPVEADQALLLIAKSHEGN